MYQHAMAASLSTGTWQVVIAWYSFANQRTIWTMPTINIPAESYDHAIAIADAVNSGKVEHN